MSAHRASNWGGASLLSRAVVDPPKPEQVAEDEHCIGRGVTFIAMLESSKLIGPQMGSMKSTMRQLAGELISASRGIGRGLGWLWRAVSLARTVFFR
jgi:hypothetical protein